MRVMSTNPSFLQSSVDGQVKNLRDWGIPLGRRFRALKLWFIIREQGVSGLQKRLRRDMANAQWLAEKVARDVGLASGRAGHLQTVCVRHEPPGLEGEALDAHTTAWVEAVNRSGAAYLTPAVLDGRWMARVSIGRADDGRSGRRCGLGGDAGRGGDHGRAEAKPFRIAGRGARAHLAVVRIRRYCAGRPRPKLSCGRFRRAALLGD